MLDPLEPPELEPEVLPDTSSDPLDPLPAVEPDSPPAAPDRLPEFPPEPLLPKGDPEALPDSAPPPVAAEPHPAMAHDVPTTSPTERQETNRMNVPVLPGNPGLERE